MPSAQNGQPSPALPCPSDADHRCSSSGTRRRAHLNDVHSPAHIGRPPPLSIRMAYRRQAAGFHSRPLRQGRHPPVARTPHARSEEHTSELQSLMRISYAVFCLKKKKIQKLFTSDHTCTPLTDTITKHLATY